MAEEGGQQVPDMDAIQDFLKSQIREAAKEVQQEIATAVPVATQEDQLQRQMQQTLDPFLRPVVNLGASALDHSRFYTANPDAVEYHDEIERVFEESVKTGRNLGRQDIAYYIDGRLRKTDPKKWQEQQDARLAKQKEVADTAVDVGFSAMDKAKNDPNWTNFRSKTVEEMESALDGIAF
jgi:hypothetical protein